MFLALIYHSISFGVQGFLFSGAGFLVGLGLLLIPFMLGGIGAGDVKLLVAIGAWKGSMFVLYTGVYAGIIGGLIAVVILIKRKQFVFTIKNMLFHFTFLRGTSGSLQLSNESMNGVSIPYAVPIAIGAFSTLILEFYI